VGHQVSELERERSRSEFKYNRVLFLDKRRKDCKWFTFEHNELPRSKLRGIRPTFL